MGLVNAQCTLYMPSGEEGGYPVLSLIVLALQPELPQGRPEAFPSLREGSPV